MTSGRVILTQSASLSTYSTLCPEGPQHPTTCSAISGSGAGPAQCLLAGVATYSSTGKGLLRHSASASASSSGDDQAEESVEESEEEAEGVLFLLEGLGWKVVMWLT